MIARVTSHWWIFLIRGIIALVLAVAMVMAPGAALFTVAIFFGAYMFVDGIVAIWASLRMQHTDSRWGWLLFEGIVGVVAGLLAMVFPGITALWLAILAGVWAILTGILSIASAIRLRQAVANEILWILTGVVSIAFGIAVFFLPALGALYIVYTIAIYAFLAGIFFIGLAFRLRGLHGRTAS